jgi:NTE family protein
MRARSILDAVPVQDLGEILGNNTERRSYPAGAIVVAEGDSPHEIYVVESGSADAFVSDRFRREHRIGSVARGGTIGEMSLLTGEPAAATIRAASDLEVLVLRETDFDRIAARHPAIYRNIGAIMADRLDRSNRRPLRDTTGRVTVLRDWGAPPELGYALASSMAWHLRRPVLLLVLDEDPAEELRALDRATPRRSLRARRRAAAADGDPSGDVRADLQVLRSAVDFAADTLALRVEELCGYYEHVLVQVRGESPLLGAGRVVHLGPRSGGTLPELERPGSAIRAWAGADGHGRPDAAGVLHVPPLASEEHSALPGGVLSPAGAAGRALGWAARDLARLKVGLALGAGGARGYAHCGVLTVLDRAGLTADYLSGTSIGAAAAAMYAAGQSSDRIADALDAVAKAAFRIAFRRHGALLSSRRIRDHVRKVFGDARFDDLELPLALTAVDLPTGQEIVFDRGLLWPAVMASMAIPGIYPAQRIGDYVAVDGGIMNPVPTSVVAEMGADVVVAVRLGTHATARVRTEAVPPQPGGISLFSSMLRSMELMQSKIDLETASAGTILIAPEFGNVGIVGLRRFAEGRRYAELGAAAAEAALPRLGAALPWLRQ